MATENGNLSPFPGTTCSRPAEAFQGQTAARGRRHLRLVRRERRERRPSSYKLQRLDRAPLRLVYSRKAGEAVSRSRQSPSVLRALFGWLNLRTK